MIIHKPVLVIPEKIEEIYSKKDGVPVKYVCSSALDGEAFAMDIFYRDTPHPEFGNKYFGIFQNFLGETMITNADKIDKKVFTMVKDENGDFHYSAHRHDYKQVGNSMIDGGRSYVRSGGRTYNFELKDGEFKQLEF